MASATATKKPGGSTGSALASIWRQSRPAPEALKVAGQAKNGEKPPSSAEVTAKWRKTLDRTVDDVLDDYIARYARPNSRSVDQIERAFNVDVRPKIGEKAITNCGG